jgi:hypothetical protein
MGGREMTSEQINIAIAEACGWQVNKHKYLAKPPNGDWQYKDKIPDYCNCLNAMHEAEKTLNSEQLHDYYENLELVNGWEYPSSTARQRAEAFLKTIGKWEVAK